MSRREAEAGELLFVGMRGDVAQREVVEAIEQFMGGQLKDRKTSRVAYEVPEEDYQFAKSAEFLRLQENFKLTTQHGMTNPFFTVHEGIMNDRTIQRACSSSVLPVHFAQSPLGSGFCVLQSHPNSVTQTGLPFA